MTGWTRLHVVSLALWAAGATASEMTEPPEIDVELLEFLGSWDAEDDQWLGAALTVVEQEDPGADSGSEATETTDDEN